MSSSSSGAKEEDLDFFDLEKDKKQSNNNNNNPTAAVASSSKSQFQKLFERRMSFHHNQEGNQSNINPLLLNNIITSWTTTTSGHYLMPKLPFNVNSVLFLRSSSSAAAVSGASTSHPPAVTPSSPLTIFYNGTVSVFDDVPYDMAERIIMVAQKESSTASQSSDSSFRPKLLENLKGVVDLPLQRKRSLQRFLEKRKDRVNPR